MKKEINVVAALIIKDNKALIAKRSTHKDGFNQWEFPGGKVEDNETEYEAIEREIREEFNVEVKAISFVTNSFYKYTHNDVNLKLYECKYVSGTFTLNVHSAFAWVDIKDLLNYDFAPADKILAKYVVDKYNK